MKKYLLTLLLAIAGCVTVMAGDDIKLSEGSIAPLKDGGIASVVIDMADTQFDNKMPPAPRRALYQCRRSAPRMCVGIRKRVQRQLKEIQNDKEYRRSSV